MTRHLSSNHVLTNLSFSYMQNTDRLIASQIFPKDDDIDNTLTWGIGKGSTLS